jgi:hypothetical protein
MDVSEPVRPPAHQPGHPHLNEAETFASLLLDHASFPSPAPGLLPGQAEMLTRVEAAFALAPSCGRR